MKQNYIDEKGNYHNELNLTLAQIYDSGVDFGRSVAKADFKTELEKIKAEIDEVATERYIFCVGSVKYVNEELIKNLINVHISELKGEQDV